MYIFPGLNEQEPNNEGKASLDGEGRALQEKVLKESPSQKVKQPVEPLPAKTSKKPDTAQPEKPKTASKDQAHKHLPPFTVAGKEKSASDKTEKDLSLAKDLSGEGLNGDVFGPDGERVYTIKHDRLYDVEGEFLGIIKNGWIDKSDEHSVDSQPVNSLLDRCKFVGLENNKERTFFIGTDSSKGDFWLRGPKGESTACEISMGAIINKATKEQIGFFSPPELKNDKLVGGFVVLPTENGLSKIPLAALKGSSFSVELIGQTGVMGDSVRGRLRGVCLGNETMADGRLRQGQGLLNISQAETIEDNVMAITLEKLAAAQENYERVNRSRNNGNSSLEDFEEAAQKVQVVNASISSSKKRQQAFKDALTDKPLNNVQIAQLIQNTKDSKYQLTQNPLAFKKQKLSEVQDDLEKLPEAIKLADGKEAIPASGKIMFPDEKGKIVTWSIKDGSIYSTPGKKEGTITGAHGAIELADGSKVNMASWKKDAIWDLQYLDEQKEPQRIQWAVVGDHMVSRADLSNQAFDEHFYAWQVYSQGKNAANLAMYNEASSLRQAFEKRIADIFTNGIQADRKDIAWNGKTQTKDDRLWLWSGASAAVRPKALRDNIQCKVEIAAPELNDKTAEGVSGKLRIGKDIYDIREGKLYQKNTENFSAEEEDLPCGELTAGYIVKLDGQPDIALAEQNRVLLDMKFADGTQHQLIGLGRGHMTDNFGYVAGGLLDVKQVHNQSAEHYKQAVAGNKDYFDKRPYLTAGLASYLMEGRDARLKGFAQAILKTDQQLKDNIATIFTDGFDQEKMNNSRLDHSIMLMQSLANTAGVQAASTNYLAQQGTEVQRRVSDGAVMAAITAATAGIGSGFALAANTQKIASLGGLGTALMYTGELSTSALVGGTISALGRASNESKFVNNFGSGVFEGITMTGGSLFGKALGTGIPIKQARELLTAAKAGAKLTAEQIKLVKSMQGSLTGRMIEAGYTDKSILAMHSIGRVIESTGQTTGFHLAGQTRLGEKLSLDPQSIGIGTSFMLLGHVAGSGISKFLKSEHVKRYISSTTNNMTYGTADALPGALHNQDIETANRLGIPVELLGEEAKQANRDTLVAFLEAAQTGAIAALTNLPATAAGHAAGAMLHGNKNKAKGAQEKPTEPTDNQAVKNPHVEFSNEELKAHTAQEADENHELKVKNDLSNIGTDNSKDTFTSKITQAESEIVQLSTERQQLRRQPEPQDAEAKRMQSERMAQLDTRISENLSSRMQLIEDRIDQVYDGFREQIEPLESSRRRADLKVLAAELQDADGNPLTDSSTSVDIFKLSPELANKLRDIGRSRQEAVDQLKKIGTQMRENSAEQQILDLQRQYRILQIALAAEQGNLAPTNLRHPSNSGPYVLRIDPESNYLGKYIKRYELPYYYKNPLSEANGVRIDVLDDNIKYDNIATVLEGAGRLPPGTNQFTFKVGDIDAGGSYYPDGSIHTIFDRYAHTSKESLWRTAAHEAGHGIHMRYFESLPEHQKEPVFEDYKQWLNLAETTKQIDKGEYRGTYSEFYSRLHRRESFKLVENPRAYHASFPEIFAEMRFLHRFSKTETGKAMSYQQLIEAQSKLNLMRSEIMIGGEMLYETLKRNVFEPFDKGSASKTSPAQSAHYSINPNDLDINDLPRFPKVVVAMIVKENDELRRAAEQELADARKELTDQKPDTRRGRLFHGGKIRDLTEKINQLETRTAELNASTERLYSNSLADAQIGEPVTVGIHGDIPLIGYFREQQAQIKLLADGSYALTDGKDGQPSAGRIVIRDQNNKFSRYAGPNEYGTFVKRIGPQGQVSYETVSAIEPTIVHPGDKIYLGFKPEGEDARSGLGRQEITIPKAVSNRKDSGLAGSRPTSINPETVSAIVDHLMPVCAQIAEPAFRTAMGQLVDNSALAVEQMLLIEKLLGKMAPSPEILRSTEYTDHPNLAVREAARKFNQYVPAFSEKLIETSKLRWSAERTASNALSQINQDMPMVAVKLEYGPQSTGLAHYEAGKGIIQLNNSLFRKDYATINQAEFTATLARGLSHENDHYRRDVAAVTSCIVLETGKLADGEPLSSTELPKIAAIYKKLTGSNLSAEFAQRVKASRSGKPFSSAERDNAPINSIGSRRASQRLHALEQKAQVISNTADTMDTEGVKPAINYLVDNLGIKTMLELTSGDRDMEALLANRNKPADTSRASREASEKGTLNRFLTTLARKTEFDRHQTFLDYRTDASEHSAHDVGDLVEVEMLRKLGVSQPNNPSQTPHSINPK